MHRRHVGHHDTRLYRNSRRLHQIAGSNPLPPGPTSSKDVGRLTHAALPPTTRTLHALLRPTLGSRPLRAALQKHRRIQIRHLPEVHYADESARHSARTRQTRNHRRTHSSPWRSTLILRMRKSARPKAFCLFFERLLTPAIHAGFEIFISGRVRTTWPRSGSSSTGTTFLILN